jgi:hypothetical protein
MTFPTLYVLFVTIVSPGAQAVTEWNSLNLRDHIDTWAFPMASAEACNMVIAQFMAGKDSHPPGTTFYFDCPKVAPIQPERPA